MDNKAFRRTLRVEQTSAESSLWSAIRGGKLKGIHFRRQHPIDKYIVDFYCHYRKLIIEVDGSSHNDIGTTLADEERDAWLVKKGYKVLRFTNEEVYKQLERVLWEIEAVLEVE